MTKASLGAPFLMGVDVLLDMGRTGTNVIGNGIATAVAAQWAGKLDGHPAPGLDPPVAERPAVVSGKAPGAV
ncbi:MAG: hypothetical protein GXD23_08195 [Comamonadaceae bacterium]|nr:hypothetical protein [Comamonadaceae bacterium]